jgi:transposase InsO family protein
MRRRNPRIGLNEFWYRLRQKGYRRCLISLYRVLLRQGFVKQEKVKQKYKAKPYEQMQRLGQRVQIDVKVVPASCRVGQAPKLYQYTAIDECSRLRYLGAYEEQSTFSSADFLSKAVAFYKRLGIRVECVQTDNGFEFTNRFSSSKRNTPTLFETTVARLGITHKLIKPYTPRHNGKVERSHREDQKRFYSIRSFYSLADFDAQLAGHQSRTNNIPMRPLGWLSPRQFLKNLALQDV